MHAIKIDWKAFGSQVKTMREAGELGLREASREVGISHSVWCRVEQGKPVTAQHYLALCSWVAMNPYKHFSRT
jgi:hypothetical protein